MYLVSKSVKDLLLIILLINEKYSNIIKLNLFKPYLVKAFCAYFVTRNIKLFIIKMLIKSNVKVCVALHYLYIVYHL